MLADIRETQEKSKDKLWSRSLLTAIVAEVTSASHLLLEHRNITAQ